MNLTCVSICSSGYFLFNSKCYKLTFLSDSIPSTTTQPSTLNKTCASDQVWNATTLLCQCIKDNSYYDNSSQKCITCLDSEKAD